MLAYTKSSLPFIITTKSPPRPQTTLFFYIRRCLEDENIVWDSSALYYCMNEVEFSNRSSSSSISSLSFSLSVTVPLETMAKFQVNNSMDMNTHLSAFVTADAAAAAGCCCVISHFALLWMLQASRALPFSWLYDFGMKWENFLCPFQCWMSLTYCGWALTPSISRVQRSCFLPLFVTSTLATAVASSHSLSSLCGN